MALKREFRAPGWLTPKRKRPSGLRGGGVILTENLFNSASVQEGVWWLLWEDFREPPGLPWGCGCCSPRPGVGAGGKAIAGPA